MVDLAVTRLTLSAQAEERRFKIWAGITLSVVVGYILFGKSFAYLRVPGIPGLPLYIGELLLLAFFVLQPRASGGRLLDGLLRQTELSGLSWSIFVLLGYGIVLALRGYVEGYPRILVAQELVFNVYPLYLFLGLWIGERREDMLERLLRSLAWLNGVYGLAYMVFLNHITIVLPGTDYFLFQHPLGQGFILLGLLAYRRRGQSLREWLPFVLNLVVLLGIQSRASWAGFLVALPVWAVMSKQIGRTAVVAATIAVLLAVAWITDLKVAGGRSVDEYSARNVIGAAVAPFDEELASDFTADARNFAGTTRWRQAWWSGIWDTARDDLTVLTLGHGYGFQLASVAVIRSTDPMLRTPHNWFFFALGYGGVLGVALFVWFIVSLLRTLWSASLITGRAFGVPFVLLALTTATFAPFFETPFAAIPAYVIAGLAAAPVLGGRRHGLRPHVVRGIPSPTAI